MATLIFHDEFTGANATLVTTRAPTVEGSGWQEVEDSAGDNGVEIQSNSARSTSGTLASSRIMVAALPDGDLLVPTDYTIEATLAALTGTSSAADDDLTFLFVRRIDANNVIFAGYYRGTVNLIKLWKKVGGTVTELDSAAYTPAADDLIKLSCIGTAIRVYVNGVEVLNATVSDAVFEGVGQTGIGWGNLASATNDISTASRLDNVKVYDETVVGGGIVIKVINHLQGQEII